MARTVTEAKVQNRAGRAKLAARSKPYWRGITEGCHVGYYRGARVGKWVARFRKAAGSAYVTTTLGEADDTVAADGEAVLDWKQAVDKARSWIDLQTAGVGALDPDISVRVAVEAYLHRRDARRSTQVGRAAHCDAYYTLTRFVLKDERLSQTALSKLTEADLQAWQERVHTRKATSLQRVMKEVVRGICTGGISGLPI